jgi:hypothetical protein
MEDDDTKRDYLRNLNSGVQCIDLDTDFTVPLAQKVLIWTVGPYIPVGGNQLASVFTFCKMVSDEPNYNKMYTQALEHITSGKLWSAHTNQGEDALQLPKGSLMSCEQLGQLLGMPCGGTCTENLMIAQIKGQQHKTNRPTNGVMIFCHKHLRCGSGATANAQRCIRIIPYFLALMQPRLAHCGGAMIMDDIEKYRTFFMARTPLLMALMVNHMTNENWVAGHIGDKQVPFKKVPVHHSGKAHSTPSVRGFFTSKSAEPSPAVGTTPASGQQVWNPEWGQGSRAANSTRASPAPNSHGSWDSSKSTKGSAKGKGKGKGKGKAPIPMHFPVDVADHRAPVHTDPNPSSGKKRRIQMQLNAIASENQCTEDQILAALLEKKKRAAEGPDQR